MNVLGHVLELPQARHENKPFVLIAKDILAPLCRPGEVFLDKQYKKLDSSEDTLQTQPTGMGSLDTWHGSPDARVRVFHSTTVVFSSGEDWNTSSSDENSDGESLLIEAKLFSKLENLPQTIATRVVSSFIEKQLHQSLSATVPTILIDGEDFLVCLYNSEKDVLLISH